MKAECKNSICMWFKKLNLIADYQNYSTGAVKIVLKTGEEVIGVSGSNQHRQYFEDLEGRKGYLCLKSLRVIWLVGTNSAPVQMAC